MRVKAAKLKVIIKLIIESLIQNTTILEFWILHTNNNYTRTLSTARFFRRRRSIQQIGLCNEINQSKHCN